VDGEGRVGDGFLSSGSRYRWAPTGVVFTTRLAEGLGFRALRWAVGVDRLYRRRSYWMRPLIWWVGTLHVRRRARSKRVEGDVMMEERRSWRIRGAGAGEARAAFLPARRGGGEEGGRESSSVTADRFNLLAGCATLQHQQGAATFFPLVIGRRAERPPPQFASERGKAVSNCTSFHSPPVP